MWTAPDQQPEYQQQQLNDRTVICKQLMPPHIEDLIAHAATRKYDQKNIYCLKNYYYYRITTGQRYYENEWNAERSPLTDNGFGKRFFFFITSSVTLLM